MAASLARVLFKTLKWSVASLLALALLVLGYTFWVVYRFDTETLPERYGQVDSKLYASAGAPRPLIVGLGGAEGGNAWTRKRWQAQRTRFEQAGYAFLALGYFGLPNTPEKLDRIALEGVHRAIVEAQSRPEVSDQCAIVIGGSKGAELALALAAHYPDIDAVVGLAPGDTVFAAHTDAMVTSSWAIEGKPLPFAPVPWSALWELFSGDILAVMERTLADEAAAAAAAIPVERIGGPILLVSANRDEMWPASRMSRRLMARLDQHGFAHAREHVDVDGGHVAVIDHFARVEDFLARVVARVPGCDPAAAEAPAAAVAIATTTRPNLR